MTKLPLSAVAFLLSLSSHAQGTVNFANNSSSRITDNVLSNTPVTAASGIHAALYWAPLSDPTDFQQLGNSVLVGGLVSGVFLGGTRSTGPATFGGAVAKFQVRAWEVAYGSTYEAAVAAGNIDGRPAKLGNSNIIELPTGNPTTLPPGSPTTLTSFGLQGFVVDVPETSVIALGVMGAGALLVLRRAT